MKKLAPEFMSLMDSLLGKEEYQQLFDALQAEQPVSIRLNPLKTKGEDVLERVPWCSEGRYLHERPQFTFDPLLHAGCYYVQEASSMFVSQAVHQYVDKPVFALDLCAAPGGKSTLLRSSLPTGSMLVCNQIMRNRAQILAENMVKWGYPDVVVTNNASEDFSDCTNCFDLILADVPCSGEGMFRKDEATISEWSLQNVEKCSTLQREIASEAWQCLKQNGIMIYSTCTFNTHENEENVKWICDNLDGEVIEIPIEKEWNITGSLLDGFDKPVYRFIPGRTRGEGLFMCAIRKKGECTQRMPKMKPQNKEKEVMSV